MGFAPQFMNGINNPQMGADANNPDTALGGAEQIYAGLPQQMPEQMPGQFAFGMNRPVGIGMPYYAGEQVQQPMMMPSNPIQTAQPSLFAPSAMMMPQQMPQPAPNVSQQMGRPVGIGMPMEPGQQQFNGGLRPAPRGYRPPSRNLTAMRRGLAR